MNFANDIVDDGDRCGARYIIRDPNSKLIAVGGNHVYNIYVLEVDLRVEWKGISNVKFLFRADFIYLDGDSALMLGWIVRQV